MKFNIENVLASGMETALEQNKDLFSKSSVLEKLAFKKVSEEDAKTEIESELEDKLASELPVKVASCKCNEPGHKDDCKCDCHKETKKEHKHEEKDVHEKTTASFMVDALIKISADLDAEGFDKLAAASLILADRIVVEAKAKKEKSKSKSKSSKEDKKDSKKSKSKGDVAARMKKMREMQGKKRQRNS